MLFNSLDFLFFLVGIYAVYLLLPFRLQNYLLLVGSYYFYGCWDWRFLGLIWLSSTVDFFVSQAIEREEAPRRRKSLLLVSMILNLGILFVFKYFGFFSSSLQALLRSAGIEVGWTTLHIVLPVGISFYTFQTMSYTVDVYRRQLKPTTHYLDYLLFVSFFPQLVAGPIERAGHLLTQVIKPRTVTWSGLREGGWLILLGYYKKVVLADNLAPFADEIFNAPGAIGGMAIVAGVLAFCFQIYGDFSGYSDIARGVARLMGFDLRLNFRMPYFAVNPSDFWRRWHISLSTWLRDYLYIPLGGNRLGTAKTYRNLALTMLLGGLWHGAAWHFVAWGAYHGLLLVIFRLFGGEEPAGGSAGRSFRSRLPAMLGFFVLTCVGWVLFRVRSLADIGLLWDALFPLTLNGRLAFLSIAVFAGPLLLLEVWQEKTDDMLAVKRAPAPARLAIYAFVTAAIVLAGVVEGREFIYFQF